MKAGLLGTKITIYLKVPAEVKILTAISLKKKQV